MTTSINAVLFPDDPPVCKMGGSAGDIPVVTCHARIVAGAFGEYPTEFTVQLGNHPDPAAWCDETAARLTLLAALIRARVPQTAADVAEVGS